VAKQPGKGGILYIVATPIGNLEDISMRAVRILSQVDVIAAEDTRVSRKLAERYQIHRPMITYHDHNERRRAPELVDRLAHGEDIALISDAGTPLISDAGYRLVRLAQEQGVCVTAVPGPCAAITALSISGLPTDRFVFEGFLPPKSALRRHRLEALKLESRTLIVYESVHRIVATLRDMVSIFDGHREAVIAREITKKFETVRSDSLANLLAWLENEPQQRKGEFVLLVRGRPDVVPATAELERVLSLLREALPLKQAVDMAAQITGASRNDAYRLALRQSED
jgi:16S rRNA (cytidine1402-2'-O)-methyltransferase